MIELTLSFHRLYLVTCVRVNLFPPPPPPSRECLNLVAQLWWMISHQNSFQVDASVAPPQENAHNSRGAACYSRFSRTLRAKCVLLCGMKRKTFKPSNLCLLRVRPYLFKLLTFTSFECNQIRIHTWFDLFFHRNAYFNELVGKTYSAFFVERLEALVFSPA